MVCRNSLFGCWIGLALTASVFGHDSVPPTAKKPPKPHPATNVEAAAMPAPPPVALSRQRRQRRQQWEKALQSPAELTVGDEKTITLGKLLEQIREKHGLNVQLDMPHLLPMAKAFDSDGTRNGAAANPTASWLPFAVRSSHIACEPGVSRPTSPQYAPTANFPSPPHVYSTAPTWTAPACAAPVMSAPTAGSYYAPAAPYVAPNAPPPVAVAAPQGDAPYSPVAIPYSAGNYPAPAVASPPAVSLSGNAAPTLASGQPIAAQPAVIRAPASALAQVFAEDGDEPLAPRAPRNKRNPRIKIESVDDDAQPESSRPESKPEAEPDAESSTPKAKPDHEGEAAESPTEPGRALAEALKSLLDAPVDAAIVTQPNATVEDILRQAMDRALPLQAIINSAMSDELPLLASLTKAAEWDLLVQDNGVLVTTRLNANLQKETRVYSIRALEQSSNLKAEEVARVLTRTVRPWSWRRYYPEATPETAAGTRKTPNGSARKVSIPKVNLDLLSLLLSSNLPTRNQRIRLTSDDDSTLTIGPGSSSEKVELTEEDLELISRVWTGMFDATVTSIQVIYHSDPPTGVVEVLPGMLIISQSQGAHRDIADLLEQLSHPDN